MCVPAMLKIERKWFVLVAGFMLTYTSIGFSLTIGALLPDMMEEFQSNRGETITVQSANLATASMFSILGGTIAHRFSYKTAARIGVALNFLAMSISYFANSITYLIITVGFFTGAGSSLMYLVGVTSTSYYFDKKKNALAVSFTNSGVSVGGLTLPYLFLHLTNYYNINGAFLIFSGICANCFVACFAFQNPTSGNVQPSPHETAVSHLRFDLMEVFRNKPFIAFAVAIGVAIGCVEVLVVILVDYSRELGFSREEGVFLLLLMNISNFLGRWVPGLLKQLPHVSLLAMPVVYSTCTIVCLCLCAKVTEYWQLGTLMCLGHFMHGGYFCMMPLLTLRLVPHKLISIAIGVPLVFLGIIEITVGPLTGIIKDTHGSYRMAFYGWGGLVSISVIIFSALYLSKRSRFVIEEIIIEKSPKEIHNTEKSAAELVGCVDDYQQCID